MATDALNNIPNFPSPTMAAFVAPVGETKRVDIDQEANTMLQPGELLMGAAAVSPVTEIDTPQSVRRPGIASYVGVAYKATRNVAADIYVAAALNSTSPFEVSTVNDADKLELRRWIAGVYQRAGVVTANSLREDGSLSASMDPYVDHSVYCGVKRREDGKLIMGGRLILPKDGNPDSLQVHINELTPDQQERVRRLGGRVAEFASYVKKEDLGLLESRLAAPHFIRGMIEMSFENGIDHWVFALNPKVAPTYERVFGNSMTALGDRVSAGSLKKNDFKPYLVDLVGGVNYVRSDHKGALGTLAARTLRQFFGSIRLPDTNHNAS